MRIIILLLIIIFVNPSYSQDVKIDSIILIKNEELASKKIISLQSRIKIDNQVMTFKSDFKEKGSTDNWGKYRIDNFLNTYITFKNRQVSLDTIDVYRIGKKCTKGISIPLTYIPDDFYETGYLYYNIHNSIKKYYILDTGPYGCQGSGCGYTYYLIFEINNDKLNVFAVEHPYSQPIDFNENLFSLNHDDLTFNLFENYDERCGFINSYHIKKNQLIKNTSGTKKCWE